MTVSEESTLNLDNYEQIIQDDVNFVNDACEVAMDSEPVKYGDFLNNIRYYPKCAVRSIMQKCDCEDDCVIKIFNELDWSDKCTAYDLKNVYNIEKYINCNGATHRPVNGAMHNYYFGNNIQKVKELFNNYVMELCDNPLISKKLECAAYELRDECANNKECYGYIGNNWNSSCTNNDRNEQYNKIVKILFNTQDMFEDEAQAINGRTLTESETMFINYYKDSHFGRHLQEFTDENSLWVDNSFYADSSSLIIKTAATVAIFSLWGVSSYFIYNCKYVDKKIVKTLMITSSGLLSLLLLFLI